MNQLSNRAVMFLVAIVLLLAAACGFPAQQAPASEPTISEPATIPTADSPAETPTEAPPTQAAPAKPPGSNPQNPLPLAETLVTPDWEIQVLEVLRGDEAMAMLKQASAFNKAHEDSAMEYVLVKIRVKYVGTEDTIYVYDKIFRGTDSTNQIYKSVSFIDVKVPDPALEADLQPGGETEGWVAIQAGKDDAGVMLVVWPYVSYQNYTAVFSEATPKWYISLTP
jgi:hypothetical protein